MERRAFLQMLCIGTGAGVTFASAKAMTSFIPFEEFRSDRALSTEPAVAAEKDAENVEIEKAYYGHWRRVNRRHYRRVSRRVYRRHYYY